MDIFVKRWKLKLDDFFLLYILYDIFVSMCFKLNFYFIYVIRCVLDNLIIYVFYVLYNLFDFLIKYDVDYCVVYM